jgi:hypothetical protein
MQVGPCIPMGIQLQKAEVGPTSGPTWRLFHPRSPPAAPRCGPPASAASCRPPPPVSPPTPLTTHTKFKANSQPVPLVFNKVPPPHLLRPDRPEQRAELRRRLGVAPRLVPGERAGSARDAPPSEARKVSGWPKRRRLAHAFLWEYS